MVALSRAYRRNPRRDPLATLRPHVPSANPAPFYKQDETKSEIDEDAMDDYYSMLHRPNGPAKDDHSSCEVILGSNEKLHPSRKITDDRRANIMSPRKANFKPSGS
jgi:hypothetical protein